MADIASIHNPLVKMVRKAAQRGTLTDDGLCIAEGFHLLDEAVRSRCEIAAVLATEGALSAAERHFHGGIRVTTIEDKVFREISTTETSQGVIILVRPPTWTIDEVFDGSSLVLVLDGIQEPGNAGALLRSAEAFGATGAVFLRGTANPFNPKCLRGSAGSVFRLPLVYGLDDDTFWAAAARHGTTVYASMPDAGADLRSADLTSPTAFVVGSEGRGIRPEVAGRAQGLAIPTTGVESLNASVAGAILLYEARRQRMEAR